MSAAAKVTATERGTCQLCGKLCHVVSSSAAEVITWDLCKGCGLAFQDLADALRDAAESRSARLEAVAQVAGQLELGADLAHNLQSVWCGAKRATGVPPVRGAICPVCQP